MSDIFLWFHLTNKGEVPVVLQGKTLSFLGVFFSDSRILLKWWFALATRFWIGTGLLDWGLQLSLDEEWRASFFRQILCNLILDL